ncbi:phosducin-like protein [Purpureocillium lilacinum]|uniref:Phosducin-like protein n=1 Tax=Purpureocillium lilacinum TaxID=33203 RepID=A0A179HUI6_PURLI|nr:phosducin-like protein [Purpureocillium lilacinum]OAQ93231.1 phosducin-like protein [Purpureocillium lilacinum]
MASAAQEEFDDLVAKNTARETLHPEDRDDRDRDYDDEDEETAYRNSKIDAAMRVPTAAPELKLPPASFDNGRATGVKGVIADARSFQTARRSKWVDRAKSARSSIFGLAGVTSSNNNVGSGGSSRSESETDEDARSADNSDEETFLQEWRETRRRELESESGREVRNRRTSPSVRLYGRLDEVDALGYLDAIEKVRRETKVVVFVYDNECDVSATIESAILPLVKENPEVHFVKVHYDDIEFDPAAVPSLLAYRNQGDLFANLTGIIEMMPDDDSFDSGSLKHILQAHAVL